VVNYFGDSFNAFTEVVQEIGFVAYHSAICIDSWFSNALRGAANDTCDAISSLQRTTQ
jgi:hypothetical protein